jgi:hypothetical protein
MKATRQFHTEQGDLFTSSPSLPAGFDYRQELISPGEERALVKRFEKLPFKPFEFHGYLGNRHIVSFGWRYDYAGRTLRESDDIPAFLLPLRQQAAALADVSADDLQQILVTEYAAGAGIGGFVASRVLDGSVPRKTFTHAQPICSTAPRGESGSTVSRPWIACAIR